MSDAGAGQLMAAWQKAISDPRARRRNDRANLRRNLPLRSRWRLWWQHRANSVFIWLCRTSKGSAIALRLWRLAPGGDVSETGLVIRAADWPWGVRCGECSRLLRDGDRYSERLEGMAGDTPVVLITCARCGEGRARLPRLRSAVTGAWLRARYHRERRSWS